MHTTKLGNIGEQFACEELVRRGYEILDRNWKNKISEIDIVARKDDVVHFIEVKYRGTGEQGDGLDYITPLKLRHMARAAEIWVLSNDWSGEYCLKAAMVDSYGEATIIDI